MEFLKFGVFESSINEIKVITIEKFHEKNK